MAADGANIDKSKPNQIRMTLWAKTRRLTGPLLQQVNELYTTEQFPYEVRHCIADWLENQQWEEINTTGDTMKALFLVDMMIRNVQEQAASPAFNNSELFPCRMRLLKSAELIGTLYHDNPLELARLVSSCLGREEQLVKMAAAVSESGDATCSQKEMDISKNEHAITLELSSLRALINDLTRRVSKHKDLQEYLVLRLQESSNLKNSLKYYEDRRDASRVAHFKFESEQVDKDLREKAPKLIVSRNDIQNQMALLLTQFSTLSQKILEDELSTWKESQKVAAYKAVYTEAHHIKKIERWCEELARILNECKQQLHKMEIAMEAFRDQGDSSTIQALSENVSRQLHYLLHKSFVVDRQPPQIVKKDARFTANVRILAGNQHNLFTNLPQVEAIIINEHQARALIEEKAVPSPSTNSGSILNSKNSLESKQGSLGATFRNMQLKKIKRADRKGQELVVEEKFCILFLSKLQVGHSWLDIWTLSVPLVVTVHGNQECQAQATILWDNAFSQPARLPFIIPEQVEWQNLSDVLSNWFGLKTGCRLTPEHLNYLAFRLLGDGVADPSKSIITRTTFHKDQLQSSHLFTFWEWLFTIQKVTRDCLKDMWNQGLIIGFISKKDAHSLLLSKAAGTFLLRFSDSELGGISIVYNCTDKTSTTGSLVYVCNLSPFTDKDFKIRSLADRVKDIEGLTHLYPDIPKDQAFGQYMSADLPSLTMPPGPEDYIKHTLSMKIPMPDINALSIGPGQIHRPMEM